MESYKPGVQTAECHKVQLDTGREILICIGAAGSQGIVVTELYVEDFLAPTATLMAGVGSFFAARDTTLSCGWNDEDEQAPYPVIQSSIERVEFSSRKAGVVASIKITASYAKRLMSPDDVKACLSNHGVTLQGSRRYEIEFDFNGHDYEPAAASRDPAKIFEDQ